MTKLPKDKGLPDASAAQEARAAELRRQIERIGEGEPSPVPTAREFTDRAAREWARANRKGTKGPDIDS
jgi:hypothetical protein